jgi:outer membrane protein assembly factor BamB
MHEPQFASEAGRHQERRLRLAWVFGLLLVAACGGPPLDPSVANLEVRPVELEFPRTFVGYPTTATLTIVNGGRARSTYEAATSDPFSLREEGSQPIGGTAKETVVVTFTPPRAGAYRGEVALRLGEEWVKIPIHAQAEVAPPCDASDPCMDVHFDPKTGTCVSKALGEGTRCDPGTRCIEEATCQAGVCKGAAVQCVARNQCFSARCDRELGCVEDPWNDCPTPTNPCKASRCDSVEGCVEVDAVDYTPCGPSVSCKERNLCIGGSCVVLTDLPDGLPCQHACGDGGSCKQKTCVRDGGDVLEPYWSHRVEGELIFPGIVDEAGHLAWIECPRGGDEPCEGISRTADGIERFRSPLVWKEGGARPVDASVTQEGRIFWGPAGIHLLGLAKDEPIWSLPADRFVEEVVGPCPCGARLLSLADLGQGVWGAIFEAEGWWGVVGIRARDGATLFSHGYEGGASSALVSDGAGRAFLVVDSTPSPLLHARGADGKVLWEIPVPVGSAVRAVAAGTVFVSGAGQTFGFHSDDGRALWAVAGEAEEVIASLEAGFTWERGDAPRLVARAWGEEASSMAYPLVDVVDHTPPTLLTVTDWDGKVRAGAVLLVERESHQPGWWLTGVDDEGEERFRCRIPEAAPHGDRWAFTPFSAKGPLLIFSTEDGEVRTFQAPPLVSHPFGWSGQRGTFSRSGRPR